jgi:hypothetical protein
MSGIFGLLVLIADIWALIQVWKSRGKTGAKVLWTVLILLLPIIGLALWWFLGGPGAKK